MNPILAELIQLLSLERLEDNLFRGNSHDIGTNRVYGGQVLGQAIKAAQYTVGDRHVHSLHAYFLRIGDHNAPIVYEVERNRDGKSFSSRRVVAIQHDQPIFTLSASFQVAESGFEYQQQMPEMPMPEQLENINTYIGKLVERAPDNFQHSTSPLTSFELNPVEPIELENPSKKQPLRNIWMRTTDKIPDDPALHHSLLAYISDFSLLSTNLLPHGIHAFEPALQIASLDHAMWFHRDFRMDEWLLYTCEGISSSESRGLARGRFFNRDGILVASTMQEGLIRLKEVK